MMPLHELNEALTTTAGLRASDMRTRRSNELHVEVRPAGVAPLANLLRDRFGCELTAIVGEDPGPQSPCFRAHYLFSQPVGNWFLHATCVVEAGEALKSLAVFHYPASRFEREISDLFGVEVADHPDPRPLVRHSFWPEDYFPLRKDATARVLEDDGQRGFPFGEVQGEGVFEIPVGPVHAGVIEPGHFRFSVVGETIIDMKARLYFTHKGIEKLFECRLPEQAIDLAERVSGDTTVGHSLAFCQAVEASGGCEVPARARYIRVILLELERLYNHIGDFGAIANDTGFAVANSHCMRLREKLLALNKRVTGNRLLRGGLLPGGVRVDLPANVNIAGEVAQIVEDFDSVVSICLENTLLMDRLEDTGRLTARTARDHGVLGFVARASGIDRDVRRDHPFAAYADLQFGVPTFATGDVKARALVRVEEVRQSAKLVRQATEAVQGGKLWEKVPMLPAFEPAFSLVEGWRGAILHWVMADAGGRLHRVKIVDPSFLNWRPLSYALLGNIVPDFPLCNKSFNQSYAGNDL